MENVKSGKNKGRNRQTVAPPTSCGRLGKVGFCSLGSSEGNRLPLADATVRGSQFSIVLSIQNLDNDAMSFVSKISHLSYPF